MQRLKRFVYVLSCLAVGVLTIASPVIEAETSNNVEGTIQIGSGSSSSSSSATSSTATSSDGTSDTKDGTNTLPDTNDPSNNNPTMNRDASMQQILPATGGSQYGISQWLGVALLIGLFIKINSKEERGEEQ